MTTGTPPSKKPAAQPKEYPPVTIAQVALRGKCPRCGQGKLFKGFISVANGCNRCKLSFVNYEQGDGPAFAGVLVVGALTAIGAVLVDIALSPPWWMHAAIWGPFVLIGSTLAIRWGKGALIGFQYNHRKQDFA